MTLARPRTVFRGARLIDGTGRPPVEAADVVVDDNTVAEVAVGTAASGPAAQVYDASGLTLMPGLIDCHVHLLINAAEKPAELQLWNMVTAVEEQTLHAAGNARTAMLAGVTTVRDMAGAQPEIAVKNAVGDGVIDGARVVTSGFVGMTAGYGDMFACPPTIERRQWPTADGVDECRKLVRRYARMGTDFIKLCTSGSRLSVGGDPGARNHTDPEVAAVVDEAHALGQRVGCHAHSRRGIAVALEAGVDTLEHGTELDEELIELMLERGTYLCPTLSVSEFIETDAGDGAMPAELRESARRIRPRRLEAMRAAFNAGVPVIMGTDSCHLMPFGRHAWELELMHRHLGMAAMECIVASTSRAAAALGIEDLTGSIVAGKRADLLLVDGDPLRDLGLLQDRSRLVAVVHDGVVTSLAARDPRWERRGASLGED